MMINIHHAKTHFSKLLQRVAEGEEITIARSGIPVARLIRAESSKLTRPLGMDRDLMDVADDFDAPLPPKVLARFRGEESTPANHPAKKKKQRRA